MMRLLAALILFPSPARAQAWRSYFHEASRPRASAAASCERRSPMVVGETQGYSDALGSGKCFVSIHPMAASMVYRDYAVFDDGMLMVFSSYGEGEGPNMTSAREFYFFPRSSAIHLEMDRPSGTVAVVMADGSRAYFAPATAQISGLERGRVRVSPRVDRSERGGVEVSGYRGLMLDAGFRLGELPSGRPDAESTFVDAAGRSCTVKNRELFAYHGNDHELRFDDDALSAWLRTRCPGLSPGF